LGRVGITPDPSRLCTEAARDSEMMEWANGRASNRVIPEFVGSEWGKEHAQAETALLPALGY